MYRFSSYLNTREEDKYACAGLLAGEEGGESARNDNLRKKEMARKKSAAAKSSMRT